MLVLSSKDELVEWAKQIAINAKTYLIITRYQRARILDRRLYVTLACEHGGSVKKYKKPIVDDEEEEIPKKRRGPYETKKCGCPFKLKGEQMATIENCQLFVHNGGHNHKIAVYSHGHAQSARLTEEQLQQTEQFRKSHVLPCNILRFFREQDGCAVSSQKIYNVVAKIKRNRMQEKNTVEEVFLLSAERGYTVFHRNRENNNGLDLSSVALWGKDNEPGRERTFCVEVVAINVSRRCQLPPETAVTKGRRKTNSTKRDKSHWEYVSIIHRKIGKSSGPGSGSGSSSGSGSNPSPRGRGRPPSSGRGRGRGRSSGRSSLSSVVSADSPPVSFPFNNEFSGFIYQFIQNWKNVVGDGNCRFMVISNFLFGDENYWVEIRRRISYDLRHRMHIYEQLFGSVEYVTELIMKTNWEEGSVPPEYWMDTLDHLHVIANTFNLCIVFLARSESTTVLPLVSNMDGPTGTIFIGLIEEL
ncbi:hypothetical protein M9H77_09585 [Catharanthus roseus]|uniref:Uncharacterized protein n=1 Tax=Catharanthus roseus TaxID=4058 RepID=A0ACC0C124_CATRO|nr:hypothetical protein M9H77_09585 [Catharanthus roseus]